MSSAAVLAALVTDDTPASLEYGDYRGWVLVDADTGEWIANVTEECSEEYVALYRVRS